MDAQQKQQQGSSCATSNDHADGGTIASTSNDKNNEKVPTVSTETAAENDKTENGTTQQQESINNVAAAITASPGSQSSPAQEQQHPSVGQQQVGGRIPSLMSTHPAGPGGGNPSVANAPIVGPNPSNAPPQVTTTTQQVPAAGSNATTNQVPMTNVSVPGTSRASSSSAKTSATTQAIPQVVFRNTFAGNQTMPLNAVQQTAVPPPFMMPSLLPYPNSFANVGGVPMGGGLQFTTMATPTTQQIRTNAASTSIVNNQYAYQQPNATPMMMPAAASNNTASVKQPAAMSIPQQQQINGYTNGSNNNPHFMQPIANAVQGHQLGALLLNNCNNQNQNAATNPKNNLGAVAASPTTMPSVAVRQPQQQVRIQFLPQPQQQVQAQPFAPLQLQLQPATTPASTPATAAASSQAPSSSTIQLQRSAQQAPTAAPLPAQTNTAVAASNPSSARFPFIQNQVPPSLMATASTAQTPSRIVQMQVAAPTMAASTLTNSAPATQQPPQQQQQQLYLPPGQQSQQQQQPMIQLQNVDAQQLLLLHNLIASAAAASASNNNSGQPQQQPMIQVVIPTSALKSFGSTNPNTTTNTTGQALPSGVPNVFIGGVAGRQQQISTTLKPTPQTASFLPQTTLNTVTAAANPCTSTKSTATDGNVGQNVTMIQDDDDDDTNIQSATSGSNREGMAIVPTPQDRKKKKKESRNSGAKIPCRARGMPADHNHKVRKPKLFYSRNIPIQADGRRGSAGNLSKFI